MEEKSGCREKWGDSAAGVKQEETGHGGDRVGRRVVADGGEAEGFAGADGGTGGAGVDMRGDQAASGIVSGLPLHE